MSKLAGDEDVGDSMENINSLKEVGKCVVEEMKIPNITEGDEEEMLPCRGDEECIFCLEKN